jgi:hypothetical protein
MNTTKRHSKDFGEHWTLLQFFERLHFFVFSSFETSFSRFFFFYLVPTNGA